MAIKSGPGVDAQAYFADLHKPPKPREYTVTGSTTIFGTPPGQTFTAIVPLAQERRLLASGAISLNEPTSGETPKGIEAQPVEDVSVTVSVPPAGGVGDGGLPGDESGAGDER